MKSKLIIILLLQLNLLLSTSTYANDEITKLRFSTFSAPTTNENKIILKNLTDAYNSIGISISVSKLPPTRALQDANRGIYDGELARMEGLEKKYKNLVRVPVAVYNAKIYIASTKYVKVEGGMTKIKNKSICIPSGYKIFKELSKGLHISATMNSMPATYSGLIKGRCDIILTTKSVFNNMVKLKSSVLSKIKLMTPHVYTMPAYHYLHIRNKHLLPKLTKAISLLTKDKPRQ